MKSKNKIARLHQAIIQTSLEKDQVRPVRREFDEGFAAGLRVAAWHIQELFPSVKSEPGAMVVNKEFEIEK